MRTLIQQAIAALLVLLCSTFIEIEGLLESDRMDEYHRRGHQWPPRPEDFTPNTPGWRKIGERRIEQLRNIKENPYDGYMVTCHTALNCKNFTENGWGLSKAPEVRACSLLVSCVLQPLDMFL